MIFVRKLCALILLGALLQSSAAGSAKNNEPAKLFREPFGVVGVHPLLLLDIPNLVERLNEVKAQWTRLGFPYRNFHGERRERFTDAYNILLPMLEQRGINVLGQLTGNRQNADWTDPDELERFREFVEYCVRTFPTVNHWEIWNEPDGEHFFGQMSNPDIYMEIVRIAHRTIKKNTPASKVVVGAFTQNGLAGERTNIPKAGYMMARMLEECYKRGLADYSDIISFHPYTNIKHPRHKMPYLRAKIGESLALMAKYGDSDKPVWLSEVGVRLGPCPSGYKGETEEVTLEDQAEWLGFIYNEIPRYRQIEKIFWMTFWNWDKPGDPDSKAYGLFNADWSRTPSFDAFIELVRKYEKDPYWVENTEPIDLEPVRYYQQGTAQSKPAAISE